MNTYKILFSLIALPFSLCCMDRPDEEKRFCDTKKLVLCAQECLKEPKENSLFHSKFERLWNKDAQQRNKDVAGMMWRSEPTLQDCIKKYAAFTPTSLNSHQLHCLLRDGKLDEAKAFLSNDSIQFDWSWSDNRRDLSSDRSTRAFGGCTRLFGGGEGDWLELSISAYADMNIIGVVIERFGREPHGIFHGFYRFNRLDIFKEFVTKYRGSLCNDRDKIYNTCIPNLFDSPASLSEGEITCNMIEILTDVFAEPIGDNPLWNRMLQIVACKHHVPLLKFLIDKKKVNVNQTFGDHKTTALMYVLTGTKPHYVHHLTEQMTQALLDAGANVNAVDNFGRSALYLANKSYYSRYEEIAEMLIAKGADLTIFKPESTNSSEIL